MRHRHEGDRVDRDLRRRLDRHVPAAEDLLEREEQHEHGPDQPGAAQQGPQEERHEEEEERAADGPEQEDDRRADAAARVEEVARVAELRRGPLALDEQDEDVQEKRPQQPEQDAEQQVAADERVADAAGEQPAPRDDGLRPVLADVGLDRDVEEPAQRRHRQRVADREEEEAHLLEPEEVVASAEPERQVEAEDDRGEPQRTAAVGPAAHVVAPRDEHRGPDREQADGDADRAARLLSRRPRVRLHAVGVRPGTDQLEVDGPAAERGRLDAEREAEARPPAGPRGPAVGGRERRPRRLHGLELAAVELGGGEQRVPVRRRRRRARLLLLRRQHLEEVQPALRVEPDVHHPGDGRGRLPGADDAGRQQVVGDVRAHEPPRARAVPEVDDRRPAAEEPVPVRPRGFLLLEVADEVVLHRRSRTRCRRVRPCSRGGPGPRAPSAPAPAAAATPTRSRPLTRTAMARMAASPATAAENARRAFRGRIPVVCPASATTSGDGVWPASSAAASGIAPGQGGGHRERRARALLRRGLEAPRIARSTTGSRSRDDRGRAVRLRSAAVGAAASEGLRVERPPAGEDLVEDEAEGVDVAPHRDLGAGELLRRHVARRAAAQVVLRHLVGEDRETEVRDHDLALAVEHHVGRLEVAVQDALLVGRGEARAHAARHVEGLVRGQAADAPQQRARGPRRRRTPSRGRAGPPPRRCRTRGRRCGWDTRRAIRTSLRKRASISSPPAASGRNLSATGWPSVRSSARYTSPMPPRPSRATIR